jgi:hypothetical protein
VCSLSGHTEQVDINNPDATPERPARLRLLLDAGNRQRDNVRTSIRSLIILQHEEYPVPPRTPNVISLHPLRRLSEDLPVPVERLGVAVQELDDLRVCIERMVREPHWSASGWRAACAPLTLRIPGARQSLADLAEIQVGRWPDTVWAVRLRAARDEVERRLLDITMSVSSLMQGEPSMDMVVRFHTDGTKLAEALDRLCGLIVRRYPEAVGEI